MEFATLESALPRDRAEAIGRLGSAVAGIEAGMLTLVAEHDAAEAWRCDGASSMTTWLMARLGVTRGRASRWVEVAAQLEHLPQIGARFTNGEISFDQVRALCRAATRDTDGELADSAPGMPVAALERRARLVEGAGVAGERLDHRERSVRWWWGEDRMLHLRGELPDAAGAVFTRALERIAYQAPPEPSGVYEPFDARCADALVGLASQSLGADRDGDRATVVVHVDGGVLAGETGSGEIQSGPVIAGETARRLACDSRWQLVAESEGTVVGVGRTSRRVPGSLRRVIDQRDQGCRFPGCDNQRWVHYHHLVHWARGGPTDLDNLITLCSYHHRYLHEEGWRITGDPNRDVAFVTTNGQAFEPVPDPMHPTVRKWILENAIGAGIPP